jgi:hypothetical protein
MIDENSRLRIYLLGLRGELKKDLEHAHVRCNCDPNSRADAEYAAFLESVVCLIDERLREVQQDDANV